MCGGVERVAEDVESGVVQLLLVFDGVAKMTIGFRGVQGKETEEAEGEEVLLNGVELWRAFVSLSASHSFLLAMLRNHRHRFTT